MLHKYVGNKRNSEDNINQPHETVEHIYINNLFIHNPKIATVYHYLDDAIEGGELTIQFTTSSFQNFDVASRRYQHKTSDQIYCTDNDTALGSKAAIQYSANLHVPLPPVVGIHKSMSNNLYGFKSFKINESTLSGDEYLITDQLATDNHLIQQECQKELTNISVLAGGFPIFLNKQLPSYDCLATIYHNFIAYNDNAKLQIQNELSEDRCMLRAHFLSLLLNQYGVQTFKVFEIWNPNEWDAFSINHCAWSFHCAMMTMDDDHNKWIWDPWKGYHKKMLTIKEWSHEVNEPRPYELQISSHMIIHDWKYGTNADAPEFIRDALPDEFKAFQAVCTNSLPNRPERPLSIRNSEFLMLFSQLAKKNMPQPHAKTQNGNSVESDYKSIKRLHNN